MELDDDAKKVLSPTEKHMILGMFRSHDPVGICSVALWRSVHRDDPRCVRRQDFHSILAALEDD